MPTHNHLMGRRVSATEQATSAADAGIPERQARSKALAKAATSSALSAVTLKGVVQGGHELDAGDLLDEMRKAGDEAVAGDLSRVERMLAVQLLTLDALFNNLAQRAGRQHDLKASEVLMRLALKAQGQARATAEALSVMKNPMPYIGQANIAHGHQQVNNAAALSRASTHQKRPNKLLEDGHGSSLDTGAAAAPGRADPELAPLGAGHRPPHG